jgi:hypothetical protein
VSRFCEFAMMKTMRNVTVDDVVFITNCQASEKCTRGPTAIHATTSANTVAAAIGWAHQLSTVREI